MRVLFAGTPPMAVPSLEKLAREVDVCAVLTAPDEPAGRGRTLRAPPVKEAAASLGIRVLQPASLDDAARREVKALEPDLLVVVAYGKIFRTAFLDLFPKGGINLHPSLLPKYRGPSPVTAAILAGDPETGISVQKLARKFDSGDILAQSRVLLSGEETTGSLTDRLGLLGADLLASVVRAFAEGCPPAAVPQVEEEATYCSIIRKEDGEVDWREPAAVIERKVRAYDPWPRMRTSLEGAALLLLKTRAHPDNLLDAAAAPDPGVVTAADRDHGILVRTGSGILEIERLQLQFRKPLSAKAFLAGRPDLRGARLGSQG